MSQIDLPRRHHLDAITSERWTASDQNRWTPSVRYARTASLESALRPDMTAEIGAVDLSNPSLTTNAQRLHARCHGFAQLVRQHERCLVLDIEFTSAGQHALPSRPGESHPEPLTDPDLTLSRHPARATERRLPPSVKNWGSSCCQLARPDVDDLLPLLHGHYPVSSLLRSSPPLAGASVLSASRFRPLAPFPLASPTRFSSSIREPE